MYFGNQAYKFLMRKHVIITKLFDSGGSNTHFQTLVNYFGKENVILVLENNKQLVHLNNIIDGNLFKTKVLPRLHRIAHLNNLFTTNIKELFLIIDSIITILILSIKNGFADITISAVEPEKHLYLLWLPFIKVTYILHSEPQLAMTKFTTFTCDCKLSKQKVIVTVSNFMQQAIYKQWRINHKKIKFVNVIYNCIVETDFEKKLKLVEPKKLYIITLGHVDIRKNPHTWLEVAKKVILERNNVEFIWLGNGPLLDLFKEKTKYTPRIVFFGLINNRQLYLEKSAIYYQPSIIEPQGIAVLEAMFNRLPCVVSNIGGLSESIQNKYNGILVNPRNIEENVTALIHLLDNAELRHSYGSNSFNRYQVLFTYNNFKTKMDVIYNN